MASIKIFGYGGYKLKEYLNITNKEVDELHKLYRDDYGVYEIERNYDYEDYETQQDKQGNQS